MSALIHLGLRLVKYLQNSSGIFRIQTNLIASIREKIFGRHFSATLSSRIIQKFSIGLNLELFPGRFMKVVLLDPKKSLAIFEL